MGNVEWVLGLAALGFTILGAEWTLHNQISRQFTALRTLVYDMKENIIEKLEYHERHDDTRFDNLGRDVWGLRVLYAKHIPDEKDK